MNNIRYLLIAENPGYTPSQRAQLLRDLRGLDFTALVGEEYL